MSTDRDTTRIVRSWLDEGVTQLPDRVLDAVLDQVPATPQRRAGWLARRFPLMDNTNVRFGLAAAAVLIAAFIGLRFLLPGAGVGGPGPSTPTPDITPSATATSAARTLPTTGPLEPGKYLMPATYGGVAFTFSVPAGWEINSDGFVYKNTNAESVLDMRTGVMFSAWIVDHVFADACVGEGTEEPVADGVDALTTALTNQAGREVGRVAPVLSGETNQRMGMHVELIAPADLDQCGGRLRTWPGLNGDLNSGWVAGPGQTDNVYIWDVPGQPGSRLVTVATHWARSSLEDKRELEFVIASIDKSSFQ